MTCEVGPGKPGSNHALRGQDEVSHGKRTRAPNTQRHWLKILILGLVVSKEDGKEFITKVKTEKKMRSRQA